MFKLIFLLILLFCNPAKSSQIEYNQKDSIDYSVSISTNYILIDSSDIFIHIGKDIYHSPSIVLNRDSEFDGTYKWSMHFDLVGTTLTIKPILSKSENDLIPWKENPYSYKSDILVFDILKKKDSDYIPIQIHQISSVPLPSAVWIMLIGLFGLLGLAKRK